MILSHKALPQRLTYLHSKLASDCSLYSVYSKCTTAVFDGTCTLLERKRSSAKLKMLPPHSARLLWHGHVAAGVANSAVRHTLGTVCKEVGVTSLVIRYDV